MSDVIFAPFSDKSPLEVVRNLLGLEGYLDDVKKGDFVGIKLHVGEYGNISHIRPQIVGIVVEELKKRGAKPFLFDCNTLYREKRWNAIDHYETAYKNGFTYATVGAPFLIGDGIRGKDETELKAKSGEVDVAYIGKIIEDIDYLFVLTHFKFHEVFGYGGAIKNVGMGMASRRGKLFQHSDIKPEVMKDKCTSCGECAIHCPSQAITIEKTAQLNRDTCIGCGMCIVTCKYGAIEFQWTDAREAVKKTLCYTRTILDKIERRAYFSVLMDITPHCDCYGVTMNPVVQNIGFLFSKDIVPIDAASVDLVEKAEPLKDVNWKRKEFASKDKVKALFDINLDMNEFFKMAEDIGLGSRDYNLKRY
jgi:uncharacterized Fe-S center protein